MANKAKKIDDTSELDQKTLDELKEILLKMKQEIEQDSQSIMASLKEQDTNDPDYYNRVLSENSASVSLRAGESKAKVLNEIDVAIKKMDTGEYGYCEITGEPISIRRLRAVPYTRYSLQAQEQIDNHKSRNEE